MTYQQALAFVEETKKYGSILGLDSIRALMKELGDVQEDLSTIHIAGTNGKGSVGAMLQAVLEEAGLKEWKQRWHFCIFIRKKCDYVLLEVGMGGRTDATNLIKKPVCSVITSVSMDHMQFLGNTLTEIARQKPALSKKIVRS